MFRKQKGVTLIEVIVSLGIIATITAGVVALTDQSSSDTRAAVTALHLKTVGEATNEYIKDNYTAIVGAATATAPVLVRVSDLIAGGYLSAGYSVSNARQQDTCVLVLEPTANNLVGMVVTEGGDTIDDLTLGQIAATVGAAGGGIYSTAGTTFRGAMGGWSVPVGSYANANHLGQKCNGTAGVISLAAGHPVMALWFADGPTASATLYRNLVPGNEGLNTMQTPILMGAGTVQVVGDPCVNVRALGSDTNGKVLSCQGGTWKEQGGGSAFWGDPVSQAAAMPACAAANANETRVRYGYASAPTRRLFTCDGASWVAVGVDHNGNLEVPNDLAVSGRIKGSTLQPTLVATEGASDASCVVADSTTWGRTAKDATGLLLSCQSGIWKKAMGSMVGFHMTDGAPCQLAYKTSSGGPWYYKWVGSGTTTTVRVGTVQDTVTYFCAAGSPIAVGSTSYVG